MTFRLVVLDIDGTIVGPDAAISGELKDALRRVREAGAEVTLATGRMLRSTLRFARELDITSPLICYQGALTADPATGTYLRHARLQPDVAAQALCVLGGFPGQVSLFVDDEIYARRVNEWARGYEKRMGIDTHIVPSLKEVARARPTLILASHDADATSSMAAQLRDRFNGQALITHSLPHMCEIAAPEAGKRQALEALITGLGIDRESVVAVGDGAGDADMLEWAGLGAGIQGGDPAACAVANRIVPPPSELGVATLLEDLLRAGRLGR